MVLPPTDVDADPLRNLIGFQLGRAQAAARSLVERELRLAGLADVLTSGMGPVLYHLFEHDGCTISDIVHRVGLDKTTVTNLLSSMQARGLVHRRRSRSDRRRIRILLSAEGRALEPQCRAVLLRIETRLRTACGAQHGQVLGFLRAIADLADADAR